MTAISAWVRAFSDASSFWRLLGGGAIVAIVQYHDSEQVSRCGWPRVYRALELRTQLFEKFCAETFPGAPCPGNSCLLNFKAEFSQGVQPPIHTQDPKL